MAYQQHRAEAIGFDLMDKGLGRPALMFLGSFVLVSDSGDHRPH